MNEMMKKGNIIDKIVSDVGCFIFDPELENVIHHLTFKSSLHHLIHDVQVNPQGEYLFFNNRTINPTRTQVSAIQKYDENKDKLTFDFQASPPEMFYSAACGGVQEFGNVFFLVIT